MQVRNCFFQNKKKSTISSILHFVTHHIETIRNQMDQLNSNKLNIHLPELY